MESQAKSCQNCTQDFVIEPDDFGFYEKAKVPPPTFCPDCRFQRRLMFRNERVLYKRKCALCDKSVISIFAPDKPQPVYCSECWWGDSWDALSYGAQYDSTRPFFEQLKGLIQKVPVMNLVTDYSTLVNSEYVNHCGSAKNCYLVFNGDYMENVYYANTLGHSRDSMDGAMWNKVELSYELIDGNGTKIFYSENCDECVDVWFSKNCVGCTNCFGCVNLRKKSYYIFNEPYSREEYHKKIAEFRTDSYQAIAELRPQIYEFWLKFPRKAYYGRQNTNSTGDYIYYTKNFKAGYQAVHVEDSAYSQFLTVAKTTDCYDITEWGQQCDQCVDAITVGDQATGVKFCSGVWKGVSRIEYSLYCPGGTEDCFGCVGARKKKYCILNTQYTKEEYFALREKIVEDMNANPYVDAMGRVWKYGDFMPYDLSPFDYNESQALQYFPLTKEEVESKGFRWHEPIKNNYAVTMMPNAIPDSINDVPDTVVNEVLQCIDCEKVYRIVAGEFTLLKRFGAPIPRKCPDCRHMDRMRRVNPPKLWDRNCAKCGTAIKTSYSPDRPEIVYCESCYQQEVA